MQHVTYVLHPTDVFIEKFGILLFPFFSVYFYSFFLPYCVKFTVRVFGLKSEELEEVPKRFLTRKLRSFSISLGRTESNFSVETELQKNSCTLQELQAIRRVRPRIEGLEWKVGKSE